FIVRDPGPADVRIDPVAVVVRVPAGGVDVRLPDAAVLGGYLPGAIRAQVGVEEIEGDFRRHRRRSDTGCEEQHDRQHDHLRAPHHDRTSLSILDYNLRAVLRAVLTAISMPP